MICVFEDTLSDDYGTRILIDRGHETEAAAWLVEQDYQMFRDWVFVGQSLGPGPTATWQSMFRFRNETAAVVFTLRWK